MSPNDEALVNAISWVHKIAAEGCRLNFPHTPTFGNTPLKSVFYPEYGGLRNVKSFQLPSGNKSKSYPKDECWINLPESDGSVSEFTFLEAEKPRAIAFVPILSKEEAISRCKAFADLLITGLGLTVKPGEIEFKQELNYARPDTPYVGAYWTVTFQRYTPCGLPVLGDNLLVRIDEQYGLRCFNNGCQTALRIPSSEQPILKSEEASALAVPFALRLKSEAPALSAFYGNYELNLKPSDTELLVARPNDMLTCRDFHSLKQETFGILIWAASFRLIDPKKQLQPAVFTVFVDALTGQLAGAR